MTHDCLETDVLIVGGGLAGSTLAVSLAQAGVASVLVEARDPRKLAQPSFDGRATALANGSQRILSSLGIWEHVADDAQAIRSIHVSERGRFGAARLHAQEEGVPALGYTLENRYLGRALWNALDAAPEFSALAPAELSSLSIGKTEVNAVATSSLGTTSLRAKVIVAADGANSEIRQKLGISAQENNYHQHAVILNCSTGTSHFGQAFERFTTDGPLALLPLREDRTAVVWTLSKSEADRVMTLADEDFRAQLQAAFGFRLGRIDRIGSRVSYPLTRVVSSEVVAARAVLIGSAAVNLHPVAGQGFNLALRDVASLAEIFSEHHSGATTKADPGAADVLAQYQQWRSDDQKRVSALTHGLIRLFGYGTSPLGAARGIGLMAFDLFPGAKKQLARQTMGLSGRLSRLARGLPLSPSRLRRDG
jgi:2-octaprenyl-6-methoxyphenol hydroxylase